MMLRRKIDGGVEDLSRKYSYEENLLANEKVIIH